MRRLWTCFLAIILIFVLSACQKDENIIAETVNVEEACVVTESTETTVRHCEIPETIVSTEETKHKEYHVHNYTTWTEKAASCSEEGIQTWFCSCGDSYTESIARLEHSYTYIITASTCTENGSEISICQVCGNTEIILRDLLGHDFDKVVTNPTCTEPGYTTMICRECNEVIIMNRTVPRGHKFLFWSVTKKPTCTESGEESSTCYCGEKQIKIYEATGHCSTSTTIVEPTCTKDGYSVTVCNDCGESLSYTTIPSYGSHSYTTKMNLAEAVKVLSEKGHTTYYPYIQNEDFDVMVCSGCGDIDINTMTFRYSDVETTDIMLGYINPLREAAGIAPLQADPWLISQARNGMTTYLSTGKAPSFNFPCWKFCVDGGNNIRHHFNKAGGNASSDFLKKYDYFAYVVGVPSIRENGIYGIMLMYSD